MRYLVTGGAGFIGSHLVDALLERGDSVVILDDLSTGRLENIDHVLDSNRVDFIVGSVLDENLVGKLMGEADACFHLASAVGVQLIVQRPLDTMLRNLRGNDIVLAAAARHKRRLLFTSTSEIYGKNNSDSLDEDSDRILGSPAKARWAYSTAKACAESLAYGYYREQGSPMVVVRLFNTVGPRQSSAYGMVLPRLVKQALAGDDLTVYGDGTQSRCFVHVHDTVRGILGVSDSDEALGQVFNIGFPQETTIAALAARVVERTGSSSRIAFVPYSEAYEAGFEELGKRVPDISAIHELTGWQPSRTLDEMIDEVAEHERLAESDLAPAAKKKPAGAAQSMAIRERESLGLVG